MKTQKGWHKFTKREMPKKGIDPITRIRYLNSWVNYKTGDMVNITKTDNKNQYTVSTTVEGKLANVRDKSFKSLSKAKTYAMKLIKSVK